MQAMELVIIQHEKNRNDQLMRKIQELEEQVNRAESKSATPTPLAPEPAEKSPLENLVQQALNRMNELEDTIKNYQTQPGKSDVASSVKGGVEKSKGPSAGSKHGKNPTHESDDDSWHDSDDGDGDGAESDDETITTPTGQTVS